ncbi:MAG: aryl-sulfate sulfotransferase [Bacteroidetes bacterium]|nr:aryl-sulfate sulfotransferase [Bacteroidota bacterium]
MKKFTVLMLFCCTSAFCQYFPYNVSVYNSTGTGYYLMTPTKSQNNTQYRPSLNILDSKGNMVFYRIASQGNFTNFKLQPNGKLTFCNRSKNYILDSNLVIKDSVVCVNGISTDNHEFIILPNGHYVLLGSETRVMDLSAYHYFNGQPGSTTASVDGGVIQELDENKNLVFQWKAFDHFQFDDVDSSWLSSPQNVDWTHCNAIDVDTDGNYLLSSRYFSEITKISRATGDIIWRFGGIRNQFTFTNDNLKLLGQHDIRRLPNGHITIFDNGRNEIPFTHPARATEFQLDEINKTATLVWSYSQNPATASSFTGNVQRLSNGSTAISFGGLVNTTNPLVVLNSAGSKIFEITFPDTAYSYRFFNYQTLPANLVRPEISCYTENGNYYFEAPASYQSYKWSTGDTTRRIQVTQTGNYQVFVNYGMGYVGSLVKSVLNIQNPCESIGILNTNETAHSYNLYQNYPNPFNPVTKIKFEIPKSEFVSIKIYDVMGREVENLVNENLREGSYEVEFNGTNKTSGIYYYKIITENFQETKKMLLIK